MWSLYFANEMHEDPIFYGNEVCNGLSSIGEDGVCTDRMASFRTPSRKYNDVRRSFLISHSSIFLEQKNIMADKLAWGARTSPSAMYYVGTLTSTWENIFIKSWKSFHIVVLKNNL